jgi:hypothetical protein
VEAEIRPEPESGERDALLAALRDELAADGSPYRSAWRAAADDFDDDYDGAGRPRSNRGASLA